MSTAPVTSGMSLPLISRRVRAYFAPVNRGFKQPTIFDPAINSNLSLDAPPSPWIDLGWIDGFTRQSSSTIVPVNAGSPAGASYQVRESSAATVAFRFKTWSKLTMALAAGAQHMNVLAAPSSSPGGIGSGAKAAAAQALGVGSSSTALVFTSAPALVAGAMIVVDVDYQGQIGFVGSGTSAAYVRNAGLVGNDADYVRRVSFNVSRVSGVSGSTVQLAQSLPAGAPGAAMKVQQVVGFVDREGGSFFQEWSALFVLPGEQGDRLFFHYPRLQASASPHEEKTALLAPLQLMELGANFRALPVTDGNDGEQVLCYRTYVPANHSMI